MKNRRKTKLFSYWKSYTQKLALSIATTIILIIATETRTNAQEKPTISLNLENVSLQKAFTEIEKQSVYKFLYNDQTIDVNQQVSIHEDNKTLDNILQLLLPDLQCSYTIMDDNLVIIKPLNNQQKKIKVTGKVIDEIENIGIPGANVYIKNTTIGTITDAYGKYTIEVPAESSILVFSSLGFNDEERLVEKNTTINVNMIPSFESLMEVVVVGYGTMKKSDLTGSISQVKADELSVVSGSNPIQGLQGKAAGVSIMTNNQPGESPTIRIRGNGSINAGNDPLIVVDGFPLVNSSLNDLNSNDIESIEILKDASATAIYGSRGANGVIMVTTKSGSSGKNNFQVNSYYGIQTPARLIETLERDEFIKFINDAYTYSNGQPVYTQDSPAPDYNTDWQDEVILDKSTVQDHSFSFSGGNEATTYMISAGMFSQEGLLPASGYKRFNARTNLNHKFSNWLSIGSHLQASRGTKDKNEGAPTNIFRFGFPTMPVKNPDGSWYYASEDEQHASYVEGNWNPVADANERTDQTVTDRILGDLYAEVTFFDGLTLKTNFGTDISNAKDYYYATSNHSSGMSSGGSGSQKYGRKITKISESILTYSKNIADHRLTLTGVYSYQDYLFEELKLSGSGFPTDITGANHMGLADPESIGYSSDKYSSKLISWTARGAYVYKDRYMTTVTGRYDGSSRFGKNNKWGFFPSVGLGWRISNESFMQNLDMISNLKLYTSYGITGNQEIDNYASLPKLSSVEYIYGNTPMLGFKEGIGNPDLKWEKTSQFDLGLDIGFWNRVNMTADYYVRITTDLLYDVPIPTTSGYKSMLQNIGEVENKGVELSINTRIIDRDFKWDVNVNMAMNKNRVVELYGGVDTINLGDNQGIGSFLIVGQPTTGVWARESAGIITSQQQLDDYSVIRSDAQLGEEMYVDRNSDGSINSKDYMMIGTTEPNVFYGISTSLKYKGISLDIFGHGATKTASDETGNYLVFGEYQIQNRNYIPSKYAYDNMWSESNPNGSFPRAGAREVYFSDKTHGNRRYFIIKNIKLSYKINPSQEQLNWIKNIKVYVNAQNYISFSNFRGYNPENGDIGYPLAKALIFGINANF